MFCIVGNFTAVSFEMAGVPLLVLEVFTSGRNTWMRSFKCQRMGTLGCSAYGEHLCVPFVLVSKMSACEH